MPRWLKLRLKGQECGKPAMMVALREDDIAKAKLGPQGVPGNPNKSRISDEGKLQLSKVLDPGHTA